MVIEDVLSEGDDMSMAPAAPPKKKVKKQDPKSKPAPTPKIPKILPRPFPPLEQPKVKPMSKAVKEFDTDQFFQKLCGTPVTISLAEILGSSPTIAKKMQDYMWITRNVGQTNSLGRTAAFDPHDARLIEIQMTLDNNRTVTTFIDCGLELDLINKQTCIKSQIPIDTSASTYMQDAGQHHCLQRVRLQWDTIPVVVVVSLGQVLAEVMEADRLRKEKLSLELVELVL